MEQQIIKQLNLGLLVYQKRKSLTVGTGRNARPQSLKEAAEKIGVSTSTLSRVETGSIPSTKAALRICKWLGVSVEKALEFSTTDVVINSLEPSVEEDGEQNPPNI